MCPPPWLQKVLDKVNLDKHFGPTYPDRFCEMPEWDREEFLEQIDFDALKTLSSRLRDGLPCDIVDEVLGHYNLVYHIEFDDNSQWVARISLQYRVYQSEDQDREKQIQKLLFESAVATQMYVRLKKSVFAPEIYTFFKDGLNEVGVPFMLMQKIDDYPLDDCIAHMSDDELKTVLSELAREMVRLAKPPHFDKIGSVFQEGEEFVVGPLLSYASIQDDPVKVEERGPYTTVEEYFTSALNRHIATALETKD